MFPHGCKFRLERAVRADRGREQGVRSGEFQWQATDKSGSSRAQTEFRKRKISAFRDGDIPLIGEGEFLVQNHLSFKRSGGAGMDCRRHYLLASHRDWRHDACVCGRGDHRKPKSSLFDW